MAKETIEADLDGTLDNLSRALRELQFHSRAAEGASMGLNDCLDREDTADVQVWAHRVSAMHQSVSEMAHVVSVEAGILEKICAPCKPEDGH